MDSKITCIVTLHGIGFEAPPKVGVDNSGYADPLHQHLYHAEGMGVMLCDDPKRVHPHPGDNGVIYVQSRWIDEEGNASCEEGMKRLGVWSDDRTCIKRDDAPLVVDGKSVAHIGLVYSNLEPHGPEIGATLITTAMSLISAGHYARILGLAHLFEDGIKALSGGHNVQNGTLPVSSKPRSDLKRIHKGQPAPVDPQAPGLRLLEDDVACYVCYNEERERVRSFVREALTRLAYRDDVDKIILNTHSNGTVIAFDVLRNLPVQTTAKIKAFVTAGSPLRKYVDLFDWGGQVQCLYPVEPWYNFWEPYDPVADPLDPPASWHLGDALQASAEKLFCRIDLNSEKPSYIKVDDRQVNNIEHSRGGGLQAHNYWDNEVDFVPQLAEIVCAIVAGKPAFEGKDNKAA